jgi:hypothetical protein
VVGSDVGAPVAGASDVGGATSEVGVAVAELSCASAEGVTARLIRAPASTAPASLPSVFFKLISLEKTR